jgi:hypothetical protein
LQVKLENNTDSMGEKLASCQEFNSALICFVLGEKYERCVNILYENYSKETERVSKFEKEALLQKLFEEILAMKYIMDFNAKNEQTDHILMDYCEMLITLNLAEQAYSYLIKVNSSNLKVQVMIDRIYGHCEDRLSKRNYKRPAFPYDLLNVKNRIIKETKTQQQPTQGNLNNLNTNKKEVPTKTNNPFSNVNTTTQHPFSNTNPVNPPVNQAVNKLDSKRTPFGNLPNPGIKNEVTNPPITNVAKTVGTDTRPPVMKVPQPKVTDFPPTTTHTHEVQETKQIVKNQPPVSNVTKPPVTIKQPQPNFGANQPFSETNRSVPSQNKPSSPFTSKNTPSQQSQPQEDSSAQVVLSSEEQYVYDGFDALAKKFFGFETNQKKQDELMAKMEHLFNKLRRHEINNNLLRLLKNFLDSK